MISLDTEMTETNGAIPARGWVLYDGECRLCAGAARRFEPLLHRHGFELAALQTSWVRQRLGLVRGGNLTEMVVLLPNGEARGGADGILQVARRIWWAWPLFALAQIPGVNPLLHAAYRRLAANRHCFGRACQLAERNRLGDVLPLVLLPIAALLTREIVPAWMFMWLMAFALYFGCKWLTWRRAVAAKCPVSKWISLAYLFAWVGMDAKGFMQGRGAMVARSKRDWFRASMTTLLGAGLIWFVVRHFQAVHPLVAGWIGMTGVVLSLHFGLFQLLALAWQQFGVNAQPIMRQPLRAVSLTEFWGRRWNAAFHFLAQDLVFRPMLRRVGPAGATFTVFLLSGVIHELVISLPARGGYGLPSMYFAIQGLGVIFERTPTARRFGLGHGWRGWMFTVACAAGPAFWLFHPVFVRNIILPMLQAISAT